MYIAYVINVDLAVSPFNGIRIQADTWADELVRQGHKVVKVNPWEKQDWAEYDLVHIIGANRAIDDLVSSLARNARRYAFPPSSTR